MNKRFIFDLDETLIHTDYKYVRAQVDYLEFMVKEFSTSYFDSFVFSKLRNEVYAQGFSPKQVPDILDSIGGIEARFIKEMATIQDDLDMQLVTENQKYGNGFSTQRFPTSFVLSYEHYCKRFGKTPEQEKENQLYSLGNKVFAFEKSLKAGALEVLDFLTQNKDDLLILTRGELRTQNEKIDVNGIRHYFKGIHVVDTKTPEYLEFLTDRTKKNYMVGDSLKSDVLPALSIGIGAIFIPSNTWKFEEATLTNSQSKKVIRQKNIKEIIEKYDSY